MPAGLRPSSIHGPWFLALLIPVLLATSVGPGRAQGGVVEGVCQREWSNTHSGTRVIFQGLTDQARTDSTMTQELGYYSIGLPRGIYAVFFRHEGYGMQALPDYYVLSRNHTRLPEMLLRLRSSDGTISGGLLRRPLSATCTLRALVDPGTWFSDGPRR